MRKKYEVQLDALVICSDHSYREKCGHIVTADSIEQVREWVDRVFSSAEIISIREVS